MARILCEKEVIEVERSIPSQVYNRYRIGRIVDSDLHLSRFELGFLALHAKSIFRDVDPESRVQLLKHVLTEYGDMSTLVAFSHLKLKGFVLKIEKDQIHYRKKEEKTWSGKFTVAGEQDSLFLEHMRQPEIVSYSIVDGDGGTSMYDVLETEPVGNLPGKPAMLPFSSIGQYRLAPGSNATMGLKKLGYEIYLLDSPEHDEHAGTSADLRDQILADLGRRGIVARTGFKYGADLRLYVNSVEDHADYLLHINENEKLKWYEVARAVRVASAVRKNFLISRLVDGIPRYFSVSRRVEV